jgi:hypothetical protein
MRFLILAIDHSWQCVPRSAHRPIAPAQTEFEKVLDRTITDRAVDLICEESDPSRLAIAQQRAYEHNPRIPWKNINMSAQERLEAGIWEALFHRPSREIEEPAGSGYLRRVDRRIPEDAIREQFFVTECLRAAEATGARSVLILCGDMHADFLREILTAIQPQTEVNRDLIPRKYWE